MYQTTGFVLQLFVFVCDCIFINIQNGSLLVLLSGPYYCAISNRKCHTNVSGIDKAYGLVTTSVTEEVKMTIVYSNAVLLLNSQ